MSVYLESGVCVFSFHVQLCNYYVIDRNDSSQDLLKELKKVQQEKSFLEQQLNNFATTKTCQTPPTTLSLVEDLDRLIDLCSRLELLRM